jgi:hypothetical protein
MSEMIFAVNGRDLFWLSEKIGKARNGSPLGSKASV